MTVPQGGVVSTIHNNVIFLFPAMDLMENTLANMYDHLFLRQGASAVVQILDVIHILIPSTVILHE
jgi:hypothetical protein